MRSLARLCLIANFIGVLALVLVLSIMNGFRESQEKKLLAIEPHVVITGADAAEKLQLFLDGSEHRLNANDIEEIAPFEKQDIIIRTVDGYFSGAVAKGLDPQYLTKLLERAYWVHGLAGSQDGRAPQFKLGVGDVIMGSELARNLFAYEGDEVTFVAPESLLLPAGEIPPFEKVRIANILTSDISDIDSQMVFYDQTKSLGRLKKTGSFEKGVELRLRHPSDADRWKVILLASPEFKNGNYEISTWGDRNSALFFALKMEKIAMSTFLSLSILITTFALFTVLIMLLTQKRKDIGLMMALGLSRSKTRTLFVAVGALLAFSGMFLGLLVGIGASYILGHYSIPLLPEIYVDSRLPARVDWLQMAFISSGLVIVGLLAAWLPVRSGLELSPSDALRGQK